MKKPPLAPPSELSEIEKASVQARFEYLKEQTRRFMETTRMLEASLILAVDAQELAPQVREWLFKELLRCASIVEFKEGEVK